MLQDDFFVYSDGTSRRAAVRLVFVPQRSCGCGDEAGTTRLLWTSPWAAGKGGHDPGAATAALAKALAGDRVGERFCFKVFYCMYDYQY